jgi:hypothetical protein
MPLPALRNGWLSISAGLTLVTSTLVLAIAGCSRPATPSIKGPAVTPEARDDSVQLALDLFHEAQTLPQFRAALNQVSGPLAKQAGKSAASQDDAWRKLAQELFRLENADMEDLDAASPRPLDAAYVESCFLFRAAARALDLSGLSPRDQAALDFAWAMRRVLLHEQQDEGVPPHLILQRGYGGVRDRALVALEVLRQAQLDGCIVECPNADGAAVLLVGVLTPRKESFDLVLFDPRLGMPVPGPKGESIATLADVRARPELLKFCGVTPAQLKDTTAHLTVPAPALAPRMKILDEMLSSQEGVVLFQDVARLQQQLTGAGLTVTPWPAHDKLAPPGRLRQFYPPDDGGVDKTGRSVRFVFTLAPLAPVMYKFQQMRLLGDVPIAPEVRETLTKFTGSLFEKYYIQPRLALLRGDSEFLLKRIGRIGDVIEHADYAQPIAEAEFQKQIAQWRDRLNSAYESRDEAKAKQLWAEDSYILALMQADDDAVLQRYERKMLTHILLRACREALGNQVDALRAAVWEDRAARHEGQAAARRGAGKDDRTARDEAMSAWKSVRTTWANFLNRADLRPAQVSARLAPVAALWVQGSREFAVGLAEQFHLDLHTAYEARIHQAEANQRLGQKQLAHDALAKVRDDLVALDKLPEPRKLLQDMLEQARSQPGPHAQRLEMLQRDWASGGHLAALRERVDWLLDAWK